MKQAIFYVRNKTIYAGYKYLAKPVFFAQDPEKVHDNLTKTAQLAGKYKITRAAAGAAFNYQHLSLEQDILGIKFKNPVGLSAGFDKDALITDILPKIGFGFAEIGSVTGESSQGNEGTRLWRLKKSKSIAVYYGLKNDGATIVAKRLANKQHTNIPIGVSVAKTNCQATADDAIGIADYLKAFEAVQDVGDYYTINISCPNTFGGQPFNDSKRLEKLLTEIDKVKTTKPVFIKLSPDLSLEVIDELIETAKKHNIQGFVCSNLTKSRGNNIHKNDFVPKVGGLSGKVVEDKANKLIAHVYQKTKGKYVVVGVGGIFTAQDAYTKIKLGASLVQLITGMIYQGPQTISEVNRGLVKLLKADGYTNISQAIGKFS